MFVERTQQQKVSSKLGVLLGRTVVLYKIQGPNLDIYIETTRKRSDIPYQSPQPALRLGAPTGFS